MKTAASSIALISIVISTFALLLVWAGTDQVHMEWVAMDDDQSLAEFNQALNPPTEVAEYDSSSTTEMAESEAGENYVLWINVSGFRSDYVESTGSPFFDQMKDNGSYTEKLKPDFPSLRYPSLISQATGKGIDEHGVTGNSLRHPDTGELIDNPTDLSFLKAEPIWTTAKRQGIPVLVQHWPFSQEQPSEHAADSFLSSVDDSLSDEERLTSLLDAWKAHTGENKIRLAMTSLLGI
ncbi:MAG: alkaline phosphatase family protein [Verrucomicrobiota bacterium]